ncbi:hypothetical protein [Clostridioides difficile]|nr:hypothetical protein [Clostridioides difficile]EQJ51301.1 hypothetical protein QSE_1027 [Clostridioides difficile P24]
MENKIIEFLEEMENLKGQEFNIIEFDNEIQELYARAVERTSSWDFFYIWRYKRIFKCRKLYILRIRRRL